MLDLGPAAEEALSHRMEPKSHIGNSTWGGFPQGRAAHNQVKCTVSVA